MKENNKEGYLKKYLKDLIKDKNPISEDEYDGAELTTAKGVSKDYVIPIEFIDRSTVDPEGGTGDLSVR